VEFTTGLAYATKPLGNGRVSTIRKAARYGLASPTSGRGCGFLVGPQENRTGLEKPRIGGAQLAAQALRLDTFPRRHLPPAQALTQERQVALDRRTGARPAAAHRDGVPERKRLLLIPNFPVPL